MLQDLAQNQAKLGYATSELTRAQFSRHTACYLQTSAGGSRRGICSGCRRWADQGSNVNPSRVFEGPRQGRVSFGYGHTIGDARGVTRLHRMHTSPRGFLQLKFLHANLPVMCYDYYQGYQSAKKTGQDRHVRVRNGSIFSNLHT